MVRRALVVFALAFGAAGPAVAQVAPDTSETEALSREDAWTDTGGEAGLVLDDVALDARAEAKGARGRLLVARGGYAVTGRVAAPGGRAQLEGLFAREPGERRTIDDADVRLTLRPIHAWTLSVGRVAPVAGAGLVLGPAWVRPRGAGSLVRGAAVAERPLVPATPARAQATARGAWLQGGRGRTRVGLLLARTARDALVRDGVLVPRPGARHVDAVSDSARGRLDESALAVALSRGPAWLVAVRRVGDPFAAASAGASLAAIRAAPRVGGGEWLEAGWRDDGAQVALARDPHGRLAAALRVASRAAPGRPATALELDGRDPRFAPPFGRVDARPYVHAAVEVTPPSPRRAWRVEAHVLERRPFDPVLAWCTARVGLAHGTWCEARRDASPPRTVVGVGGPGGWRAEVRFDRHGLARERWVVGGRRTLPGARATLAVEAALGGGRVAGGLAEPDVPGGGWVGLAGGDARTRVALSGRGRLAPALTWVRTDEARGARSELRFGLSLGPGDGP